MKPFEFFMLPLAEYPLLQVSLKTGLWLAVTFTVKVIFFPNVPLVRVVPLTVAVFPVMLTAVIRPVLKLSPAALSW